MAGPARREAPARAQLTPRRCSRCRPPTAPRTGDWIGVSARVSALVYNTDKLTAAQLPTSILDLADPQWKGKLELAPAETDFWPIVSSVAKTYGDAKALAWLKGLKSNAAPEGQHPGQRDRRQRRQQGHRRHGPDQPLLLLPAAGRDR